MRVEFLQKIIGRKEEEKPEENGILLKIDGFQNKRDELNLARIQGILNDKNYWLRTAELVKKEFGWQSKDGLPELQKRLLYFESKRTTFRRQLDNYVIGASEYTSYMGALTKVAFGEEYPNDEDPSFLNDDDN